MRALAIGLAVLALAVLATWVGGDAAWLSAEAPRGAPAMVLGSPEPAGSVADIRSGAPVESGYSRAGAVSSAADAKKPATGRKATDPTASQPAAAVLGPPPRVRHLQPGTPAHAKAIAASIGSKEFQETVSPLARLYFASFGRFPDVEGLDYYARQRLAGMSLEAIADEFAGSAEFEMRYGRLDNASFVDRILRNAGADASARGRLIAQLDSGAMTRGGLMITYSEDAGFAARLSNRVFVSIAYAETLNRTPDPAGFARWVAHLDAGHPRQSVISGLLASR